MQHRSITMKNDRRNKRSLGSPWYALVIICGFIFMLLNAVYQMPWYAWFVENIPRWAAVLNSIVMGISGIMAITRMRVALITRGVFFIIFVLTGLLWGVSTAKAPLVSYGVLAVLLVSVIVISGLRKADKADQSGSDHE